jgi:hypothetical protein
LSARTSGSKCSKLPSDAISTLRCGLPRKAAGSAMPASTIDW